MTKEQLFGSGLHKDGRADHDGLKMVLHRYIIDAIEERWNVWPRKLLTS